MGCGSILCRGGASKEAYAECYEAGYLRHVVVLIDRKQSNILQLIVGLYI